MIRLSLIACALVATACMHAQTPCFDGFAGDYPCEGLDLLSVRSLEDLGGGANGNDCWGWVDPDSDREFVLYGRSNGLSVVEVTDPVNPVFVARVPTATVQSLWRDATSPCVEASCCVLLRYLEDRVVCWQVCTPPPRIDGVSLIDRFEGRDSRSRASTTLGPR